jgi:uncharacterized surface protein with fasciclin (FAS1) repeats
MKNSKMFHTKAMIQIAGLGFLFIMGLMSCEYNKKLDLEVTSTENITGYLEANKEQFSELMELMDRTITISGGQQIKYSSFLGAYGTYTLFAPTNDAINTYLQTKKGGKTIEQLSDAEVKSLLNIHILQDTISTTNFTDGKIDVVTMYGQYLVTGSIYDGSSTRTQVNKQAYIIQKNIKLGNGVLHVIDGVLQPADSTSYQMLKARSNYSIFTEALEATGYSDALNVTFSEDTKTSDKQWLTVMATPNSVYNAMGITLFDQLKAKYSNLNDPKNASDGLHMYMGYHIINGLDYVADFSDGLSYNTLIDNNVIFITKSLDTVLINQFTINSVLERGVQVNRSLSDNSSSNGVWHSTGGNFYIKSRLPEAVFWDMGQTFPELKSLVGSTGNAIIASGQVDGITYDDDNNGLGGYFSYYKHAEPAATATRLGLYRDYFTMQLRPASRIKYLKLRTPFVAAGKYKVWLCYIETGSGYNVQAQVAVGTGSGKDSTIMTNLWTPPTYLPERSTRTLLAWDNYLLSVGYKRYLQLNTRSYNNKNMVGRLLGTATFTTSGLHWVSFKALAGRDVTGGYLLDGMQFIPSTDNQIWPKFNWDGTKIPEPKGDYNDDTDENLNLIMNP